jgi:hypothetical protein
MDGYVMAVQVRSVLKRQVWVGNGSLWQLWQDMERRDRFGFGSATAVTKWQARS